MRRRAAYRPTSCRRRALIAQTPVDRRAEPPGLAAGDLAHHPGGTGGGGHSRRRDRAVVLAVAHPRAQPLSLRGDPAGDADRRDRAADHHLGARAVSRAAGLRLDRRVLPDRREHDGRAQQRRPQSAGAVPALRRLAPARPCAICRLPTALPYFLAGLRISGGLALDRRGRRRIRRRHRRRPRPGSPSASSKPATASRSRASSPRCSCCR